MTILNYLVVSWAVHVIANRRGCRTSVPEALAWPIVAILGPPMLLLLGLWLAARWTADNLRPAWLCLLRVVYGPYRVVYLKYDGRMVIHCRVPTAELAEQACKNAQYDHDNPRPDFELRDLPKTARTYTWYKEPS